MNDEIERLLAEGEPPDAAMLEKIAAQFSASAKTVRALPSNVALWAISFAIFVTLAVIVASVVKLYAIDALSGASNRCLLRRSALTRRAFFTRAY